MAAAAVMRQEIDVPALRAQKGEIAARGFRAGDDDEAHVAGNGFARPHHHEIDAGLELERIEIVEIGDPRQRETGDLALARLARIAQAQRILGRQLAGAREPGQHAEAAPCGLCFDQLVAVVEQRRDRRGTC